MNCLLFPQSFSFCLRVTDEGCLSGESQVGLCPRGSHSEFLSRRKNCVPIMCQLQCNDKCLCRIFKDDTIFPSFLLSFLISFLSSFFFLSFLPSLFLTYLWLFSKVSDMQFWLCLSVPFLLFYCCEKTLWPKQLGEERVNSICPG